MNKEARKKKNQEMAAAMKRDGIERTTARCAVCYKVIHADYLKRGMAGHVCSQLVAR